MNTNKFFGLVGLVGAAFIGGAMMPSLIREGTATLHPFIFNWLRVFFGLVITLIVFKNHYNFKTLFTKEVIPLMMALGLGLGLNITLFSFAIKHTTLIASQLIYVLVPVITSILAFLIIKEKINFKKILGLIISLTGVLILIIFSRSPEERLALGTFYGNILIFIGVFGFSTYLTFSKKYNLKKSVTEMLILTNVSLIIFFSPLALYQVVVSNTLPQLEPTSSWAILGIVLTAQLFTWLSQLSIKHLAASTASLGSLLSPEFAALTGIVIYREKLSPILLLSLVMAITGVIISTNSKQQSFTDKIKQLPRQLLSKIIK